MVVMILSGDDISEALATGMLGITPHPDEYMYSSSSVDLRLGNVFTTFDIDNSDSGVFVTVERSDPEDVANRYGKRIELPSTEFLELAPGEFALAYTLERVELPEHLAARVEGKSSLARFGLSIHQTAPTVHAGFRGVLRLELANLGPFFCRLSPGIRICQLIIEELRTPYTMPLRSRFQDQSPSG